MELNLVHLIFSLTLDGYTEDRFALFSLRRGFPAALKRVTCGRLIHCEACRDTADCGWFPLFGQPLSTDPDAVKRHQKPPLPFVFSLPLLSDGPLHCSDVEVGLTLVGNAVAHAGSFVVAMRDVCGAGFGDGCFTISLDDVLSQGAFGERVGVEFAKRGGMPLNLKVFSVSDVTGQAVALTDGLSLSLVTPLRLFHEGRLLRGFDSSLFLRGLVRRVSSLAAAYGNGELTDDFRWLALRSREVRVTDSRIRYDISGGMINAGIVGEGVLTGDLEPFLPYLRLGEYLHAGKGASWGFGRLEIDML
jgi:hypothetical protein